MFKLAIALIILQCVAAYTIREGKQIVQLHLSICDVTFVCVYDNVSDEGNSNYDQVVYFRKVREDLCRSQGK